MPRRRAHAASLAPALMLASALALTLAPAHARAQQAAAPTPLELRLRDVEREQAEQSTLLPWVVLTAGLVTLAAGTAIGVGRVLACDGSCRNDFWPGWLVVGGSTIATGGLVWLRLQQEDIADLESRRFHLQNQLDASRYDQQAPASAPPESAALGPRVQLRLSF